MLYPNESRFSGFKLQGTSLGGVMPPEEQEHVRRTFARIALIILCLFGVLFLRLWFLQLLQGDEMQQRSEHNRIRLQDLPPWRGMILDHQGQVLVANRPSFELVVVLEDVGNIPLLAGRLAHLLRLDPQQLTAQLQNGKINPNLFVRKSSPLQYVKSRVIHVSSVANHALCVNIIPQIRLYLLSVALYSRLLLPIL